MSGFVRRALRTLCGAGPAVAPSRPGREARPLALPVPPRARGAAVGRSALAARGAGGVIVITITMTAMVTVALPALCTALAGLLLLALPLPGPALRPHDGAGSKEGT